MKEFSLSDLNRRTGELTDIAMVEPVVLHKRGRKVLVLMSVSAYEALQRRDTASAVTDAAPGAGNVRAGKSRLSGLKGTTDADEEP